MGVAPGGSITSIYEMNYLRPTRDHSDYWDTRLNGRYTLWGRRHELAAGINGYDTRQNNYNAYARYVPASGSVLHWTGQLAEPDWSKRSLANTSAKTQQYGLYLATRLHATDDLSVIAGGRMSWWENRTVNNTTGTATDDRKESAVFTPYAALVYDVNNWLSAYVSYTEIFNPQNYKDVSGNVLDPEKRQKLRTGPEGRMA